MKIVLRILLFCCLGLIGYGYYLNQGESGNGEIFIGSGALLLAFVLMPLFIYHRYKDKDLRNYSIKDFQNWSQDKDKD